MRNTIGRYKGVDYKLHRICDILAVDYTCQYYFVYDQDQKPTGDHYPTQRELFLSIDNGNHDSEKKL